MTREEQIIAKAGDLSDFATNNGAPARYSNGYYEGFQEGAKWADEHPREGLVDINKVYDFIEHKLLDYVGKSWKEVFKALDKSIKEK